MVARRTGWRSRMVPIGFPRNGFPLFPQNPFKSAFMLNFTQPKEPSAPEPVVESKPVLKPAFKVPVAAKEPEAAPEPVKPILKSALKSPTVAAKETGGVSFPKKEVVVEPPKDSVAAKKDMFGGVKAVAGGGSSSKSYRVRPAGKLTELPKVPEAEAAKPIVKEEAEVPRPIREAPKVSKLQFQTPDTAPAAKSSQSVRGKSIAAPVKSSSEPVQPKPILKNSGKVAEAPKASVSIPAGSGSSEEISLPKVLGEYDAFCKKITSLFDSLSKSSSGSVSSAPHLKNANKKEFSISICTVDGTKYSVGDVFASFSLQQTIYPFLYAIASAELKDLDQFVENQAASSDNPFVLPKNKVQNGLCDAGALLICSKLFQMLDLPDRIEELSSKLSNFSSSEVGSQLSSYFALKKCNYSNKALAYWLVCALFSLFHSSFSLSLSLPPFSLSFLFFLLPFPWPSSFLSLSSFGSFLFEVFSPGVSDSLSEWNA